MQGTGMRGWGGVVLSFCLTGEAGTGGGGRRRQKLGVSGGFGQFLFRVYTKRMQDRYDDCVPTQLKRSLGVRDFRKGRRGMKQCGIELGRW